MLAAWRNFTEKGAEAPAPAEMTKWGPSTYGPQVTAAMRQCQHVDFKFNCMSRLSVSETSQNS